MNQDVKKNKKQPRRLLSVKVNVWTGADATGLPESQPNHIQPPDIGAVTNEVLIPLCGGTKLLFLSLFFFVCFCFLFFFADAAEFSFRVDVQDDKKGLGMGGGGRIEKKKRRRWPGC